MEKLQRKIAVILIVALLLTSCNSKDQNQENQKLVHPPNIHTDDYVNEIPSNETEEEKDSRMLDELGQEILRLERQMAELENLEVELENLKLVYTTTEHLDQEKQGQISILLEENLIQQEGLDKKLLLLRTNKQLIENHGLTPEQVEAFYAEEVMPKDWDDIADFDAITKEEEQPDTLEEPPNEK